MIRVVVALFVAASLLVARPAQLPAGDYSLLWGRQGELWKPDSRLPDFSFAGYHRGERELPSVQPVTDVTRFGAAPDDGKDDTDAFRKAVAATDRGALYVPEGRYIISDIIEIEKSGVVVRGAGPEKTILFFPRDLEDIRPNMGHTTSGRPTSNYSWSGGFLWASGEINADELSAIVEPARRGARQINVADSSALDAGMDISIMIKDDGGMSLINYLYAGDAGPTSKLKARRRQTDFVARVLDVDGQVVTIDRPLPFEVRLHWRPVVAAWTSSVSEIGIEEIGFEFPLRDYDGHFTERGANAISLSQVTDSWVRNVRIHHSDSGIYVTGNFCTVDGALLTSDRNRDSHRNSTGHHGIQVSGNDNLVRNFDFQTRFIHDLTVAHCHGNVFCDGRGEDLSLDHHKYAPYANLFTNLDAGEGTQLWICGGGKDLGKNTAAWGTFWNIRAAQPFAWPPKQFCPDRVNLVGLTTDQMEVIDNEGRWFEVIAPSDLEPQNLWKAQLQRRLSESKVVQE